MPLLVKDRTAYALYNQPWGAPLFYRGARVPRVVTAEPWAFLRYRSEAALTGDRRARAVAYVEQAFDFFQAASNPRLSSRPLLYYYSFLNLAKVLILHLTGLDLPLTVHHGLRDPRANIKKRLNFAGQKVLFSKPDVNHSSLYPEFLLALGGKGSLCGQSVRVVTLLEQMPGIHRTFCAVMEAKSRFCPLNSVEFCWNKKKRKTWAVLTVDSFDRDVKETLPALERSLRFRQCLRETSEGSRHRIFKSRLVVRNKAPTPAIGQLSEDLRALGLFAILTENGYRYYIGNFAPRSLFPQLCSIYAAMFYLGSITRYKPHHFDSIVSRGYEWLVADFLDSQPSQFLYLLASTIAGVEVKKPYATVQ